MKEVILIDDEIWALKDLTRMIERNPGWRVTGQFTDSNEALDAILASTRDLVVTDLRTAWRRLFQCRISPQTDRQNKCEMT